MGITFRHAAGFGLRMEYWLLGRMLREGLDVYVPLVDDFGIDAVIRKQDKWPPRRCRSRGATRSSDAEWTLDCAHATNAAGPDRWRPPDADRKRFEVLHDCGEVELVAGAGETSQPHALEAIDARICVIAAWMTYRSAGAAVQ